jgi:hypothetical protein
VLRIRDVLSRIRIRPLLHPGSGSRIRGVKKHRIWIRPLLHPGSRIRRVKKHRIPDPDPQHCPKVIASTCDSFIYGIQWMQCDTVCKMPVTTEVLQVPSNRVTSTIGINFDTLPSKNEWDIAFLKW